MSKMAFWLVRANAFSRRLGGFGNNLKIDLMNILFPFASCRKRNLLDINASYKLHA